MMKKLLNLILSFAMAFSTMTCVMADEEETSEPSVYYVCIGDSVAGGYTLPGTDEMVITNTRLNYKNDSEYTYPHLVAEAIKEATNYDGDLYDMYANVSTVGATVSDFINFYENEDAFVSTNKSFGWTEDEIKFHDIYVEETAKADIITLNAGNNDMITAAMRLLSIQGLYGDFSKGNKPYVTKTAEGYRIYDDVYNPVLTMLFCILWDVSEGKAGEANDIVEQVKSYVNFYESDESTSSITMDDITEAIDYMSYDNLSAQLISLVQSSETEYPKLIQCIREINPDVAIVVPSFYYSYGSSLEVDGKTYDFNTIVKDLTSISFNGLIKGESQDEIMSEVTEELAYPLVYLMMGRTVNAAIDEFNAWLEPFCEENGLVYVDITGLPNENNMDPHPLPSGHAYIAQQIEDAIIFDVTTTAGEGVSVAGNLKAIYGCNTAYTYTLDKDYSVSSVEANGKTIEFDENGYNVVATGDTNVTVNTEFTLPFTDVAEGKWYYSYITDAYKLGIMTGTTDTTFNPSGTLNRGMLATILYRMAGSPEVENLDSFEDVAANKYYAKAVAWCKESGVVSGYKDGTFKPSQAITRQELASMLMRYADYCGVKGEVNTSVLDTYSDADTVSNWAKEAMAWAVTNEVITGDQGNLNPKGTATRAQAAKMIVVTNSLLNK